MPETATPCPCGSGREFADCCAAYLAGSRLPDTAEALMRSRYTAYVLNNRDYLLATWHTSTRPSGLPPDPLKPKWLGLKIMRTTAGSAADQRGEVEFIARCKVAGRAARLHELSEFVREGGRWWYLRGIQNDPD